MKLDVSDSEDLIHSVLEVLEQGELLLEHLTDDDYTRSVSEAFDASIGGHYRHCLDHFRSLLNSATVGELNYDRRRRSTQIETERFAALNATRQLRTGYERLSPTVLDYPLLVTCKTSYAAGGSQFSRSTVGREIMYSVAHAVHHYALIGVMCRVSGLRMPSDFGVAPSTLRHQADAVISVTQSNG